MSGYLFDTNILIDALNEVANARLSLANSPGSMISRVTWIEVMAGVPEGGFDLTERFLSRFRIVELDEAVARRSYSVRRELRRIRLPDAIILASAQVHAKTLVTRNIKDFREGMSGIHIPYQL